MNNRSPPALLTLHLLLVVIAPLTLASCSTTYPSMTEPKQTAKVLKKTTSEKVELNYLLFLPQNYSARSSQRWPLILFLHGIGECGNDPRKVKVHGPPKVAEQMSNFPFIVVSPQCPNGQWWANDTLT